MLRKENNAYHNLHKTIVTLAALAAVILFVLAAPRAVAQAEETDGQEEKKGVWLEEYQADAFGNESPWADGPLVLPGSAVSKIPRIHNSGPDAYVRAKLIFRYEDGKEVEGWKILELNENWKKAADGYYYCEIPVKTGESVDLFQGIRIPETLSQDYEGRKLFLDIAVESSEAGFPETPGGIKQKKLAAVDTSDPVRTHRYFGILAAAGAFLFCRSRKAHRRKPRTR